MKRSRTYTFLARRPGGYMNWPGGECTASFRIRAVAVMIFRKWFGREPTGSRGLDGFMAQAWDERGNHIGITQWNRERLPVVKYDPAFAEFQKVVAA